MPFHYNDCFCVQQIGYGRNLLVKLIDPEKDSLRFYNLGDHYNRRIEHFGVKPGYDAEGTLMV